LNLSNKAILVFEDGRTFDGASFGAEGETFGEIVFNTSMTGYQEILTDPSYAGQIVCMTYPLIGNYGVNTEDVESRRARPLAPQRSASQSGALVDLRYHAEMDGRRRCHLPIGCVRQHDEHRVCARVLEVRRDGEL